MSRLGPWGPSGRRRVAVAVSGGADSTALAFLASRWSNIIGLIVDHGLRPESAQEAVLTMQRLDRIHIETRIVTLRDLRPVASWARAARYAALAACCRDLGLVDLLLGHHCRDQAETVLMRAAAGSGLTGLAGMSALIEQDGLRLLRPLLDVPPGRLRATLQMADLDWVEDPSNQNPRALRTQFRVQLNDMAGCGERVRDLADQAALAGSHRAEQNHLIAEELAERVSFRPEACALLHAPLSPPALSAVLRTISGRIYPVRSAGLQALAERLRSATLGGCRIVPAARRLGAKWLVVREESAMQAPIPAKPGQCWDQRFHLPAELPWSGASIGGLGADAVFWRHRSSLPAAALRTLPAFRQENRILAVPHLEAATIALRLAPPVAAAAAPFVTTGFRLL